MKENAGPLAPAACSSNDLRTCFRLSVIPWLMTDFKSIFFLFTHELLLLQEGSIKKKTSKGLLESDFHAIRRKKIVHARSDTLKDRQDWTINSTYAFVVPKAPDVLECIEC